jgi:hypothetical protein
MKDGLRFVDCDMHIMEPPDLFERTSTPRSSTGCGGRSTAMAARGGPPRRRS